MRSIPYFRNYGKMPLLSLEQTALFLFQEEAEVPSGAGRLAAQVRAMRASVAPLSYVRALIRAHSAGCVVLIQVKKGVMRR